jgi:hypothetical protein
MRPLELDHQTFFRTVFTGGVLSMRRVGKNERRENRE